MSNAPTFYAYAVKDRGEGKKAFFTRIGSVWPTKSGDGFNIKLDALPIDGEITLLPPKEETPAA